MPASSYKLLIDGNPAPAEVIGAIQEIVVEDHADMADMIRLRVGIAVERNGSTWTSLDDETFPRLANLRLSAIVGSSGEETLIDAYVIETQAAFSNSPGKSYLDVVGMDPTVLMSLEEKVKAWPNMSDSSIATAIFGDHGLQPDVESTQPSRQETAETPIQRGTDIRFLQQLAARNGYECYVDVDPLTGQKVGHFHKPRVDEQPQGVLTVNMGPATNVNAFKARFEMLKPVVAEVAGLAIETQSDQDAESEQGETRSMGSEGSEQQSSDRPRRVLVSQSGLHDAAELQRLAAAVVDRSAFAITAEGELNTLAYGGILRAKKPVLVRGAGQRFSGLYYVERVLHSFTGRGYRQLFKLRRNALGLSGSESFREERAAAR